MKAFSTLKTTVSRVAGIFSFFRITEKSAALAFYALFALSPILVLVMSVASFSFLGALAENGIQQFFTQYFGPQSQILLDRAVAGAEDQSVNAWVAVVGFLLIVYGSVNFFRAIQSSLFELFSVDIKGKSVIKNYVRIYLYSFGYLLTFLFFIVLLFASQFFLTIGIEFVEELFSYNLSAATIRTLTAVMILVLLSIFLGASYRLFSRRTVGWGDAFIGGFAASILILILNRFLGLYFSFSKSLALYGAAGFLVAILLWIYLFAIILFSGALVARYASRV